MREVQFTVGKLLSHNVQNFLDKCIHYHDLDIRYYRAKGLFQDSYTVKGPAEEIQAVVDSLNDWSESIER